MNKEDSRAIVFFLILALLGAIVAGMIVSPDYAIQFLAANLTIIAVVTAYLGARGKSP